jgi:hypothetical protein
MAFIKWTFIVLFWLVVAAFFHYTLPQNDIVRVTGTEVIRKDFSGLSRLFYAQPDAGDNEAANRDLRLINTTQVNGRVMVYRNEDTGWGWPPYFKFDSSNLQAEASEVISTRENPVWVAVRHYGWRNPFLSIYPNAIGIRVVSGPDASLGLPWFNILVLTVFVAIVAAIWFRWRRFKAARIDPIVEDVQEGFDAVGDTVSDHRSRFKRWLDTWRPKR